MVLRESLADCRDFLIFLFCSFFRIVPFHHYFFFRLLFFVLLFSFHTRYKSIPVKLLMHSGLKHLPKHYCAHTCSFFLKVEFLKQDSWTRMAIVVYSAELVKMNEKK